MAIVFGLQSSRPFLGPSQHVTVFTDHVSATYLQTLKASRGLLYCLALKLEEFQPNIQFLPGKSNIYADYMSRYATPKTQTTPCIQPSGDTDSDIEEFHEVILPLSDQASIHNHHPTSAHSTSAHIAAPSPSSIGFTLHDQQLDRDNRSSDESRPKTDNSNPDENNRINFDEPDETINLLFPPEFSDLNERFRVKHLPSIENILIAQRNDAALKPIIAFLEHGSLPDDTAAARKIIFQSEQYILSSDGLLLHIYSNRRSKQPPSSNNMIKLPFQAPSVIPGNSRDHQPTTVRSVQHNNLISFPRSLIPSLMPHADSLRRSARINNRPYATKYSHFRTLMHIAKRH